MIVGVLRGFAFGSMVLGYLGALAFGFAGSAVPMLVFVGIGALAHAVVLEIRGQSGRPT